MELLRPAYRRIRRGQRRLSARLRGVLDPRPRVFVLIYHRVLPDISFNPHATKVSVEAFRRQLSYVKGQFPVISLGDLVSQLKTRALRAPVQVVITFDDGYRDNCDYALPLLRAFDLTAAFFLATKYIGREHPIWDYEIALRVLVASRGLSEVDLPGIGRLAVDAYRSREAWLAEINERMKGVTDMEREELLGMMHAQAGGGEIPLADSDCCMTWEQVKTMRASGMEIGAHTHSHPSLARIPLAVARDEIATSKRLIEDQLGERCAHFAFPFGSANDYDENLISEVERAGFDSALLNIPGWNTRESSPFHLRRVIVTEDSDLRALIG